jgi:DNA polymerase-3 subunit beta
MKGKVKMDFSKSKDIILPLRMASEALRILGDKDDNVNIAIDQNQVLFDFDDTHLISRLVEGNYPDYEAIIPKSSETKCHAVKADLEEAVKLAGCFSSKLNDITFKTNSSKSLLDVFSNNAEYGNHHAKINSEIKGKDVGIVFNWKYVLDGIKNIRSEEINFEFNGDQKPAVVRPAGTDDFFYILMPIKNT